MEFEKTSISVSVECIANAGEKTSLLLKLVERRGVPQGLVAVVRHLASGF